MFGMYFSTLAIHSLTPDNSSYFQVHRWNKPADVTVPDTLFTSTPLATILIEASPQPTGPLPLRPARLLSREEWFWSLYWTHWINILRRMHIVFAPPALPHDRLENTIFPKLHSSGSLPVFLAMSMAYGGVFVSGWNNHFPSSTERIVWRTSSLAMMFAMIGFLLVTGFAYVAWLALKRRFSPQAQDVQIGPQSSSKSETKTTPSQPSQSRSRASIFAAKLRNNSVLKDPSLDVPLKATLPAYFLAFVYCCARTCILLLDVVQLRSLPASAFVGVDWNTFFLHFA